MDGRPIIFINVGSMTTYRGLRGDAIVGGGQYPREHGFRDEMFNFQPYHGHCYGYGHPANGSIAIERLGAQQARNTSMAYWLYGWPNRG